MSSPLELVLSKLPDSKRCGKRWQALCPAHDDRNPSLAVAEGSDGRVLLKCHAGCTVEAICAALGLRVADLMPADSADVDKTPGNPRKKRVVSTSTPQSNRTCRTAKDAVAVLQRQFGKPSGSWFYHDAQGEPVGVVVRWDAPDGKVIRPVARNGEGWVVGGMAEPRPLYRLTELAGARRVYVTEGEKAADAARSIDLIAMTSPHGSKSAEKADWTPLAGKEIIVLPDNDDAGREYAKAVATILGRLKPASRTKVLELADLPEGGDVFDWLDQRDAHDPDELRHTIEKLADEATAIRPGRFEPAILPWRPFPLHALPEPIRGFVTAGTGAIGCDSSYLALPVLTVLAACIGNAYRMILKRGWSEPSVLWCATVGESGSLKSPPCRLALRPVKEAQHRDLKEYEEALPQYRADQERYEAERQQWRKKRSGDPPMRPEEPKVRRLLVSDVTVESLAPMLLDNPRGLLCARDELAAWVGSFDRYSPGGKGADSASWLSLYDADMIIVDRKTGDPRTIIVPAAAVSVVGTIQPGTLRRVFTPEMRERGLLARLLLAMPPSRPALWTEAEIDEAVERSFAELVCQLLELAPGVDEDGMPRPRLIPLSADGKASFTSWHDIHAQELSEEAGDLAAAFSKIKGVCPRLALLLHCVRVAAGDPMLQHSGSIDAASVGAAIELAEWFKHEARRVYATLGESDEERKQRWLVELIQRKGGTVAPRDLMRSTRQFKSADDAEGALNELEKAGLGQWEECPTTAKGGRPGRHFRLFESVDVDTTSRNPRKN